jgi:hypothetical protein
MTELDVRLSCTLCEKSNEWNIPMPAGWDSRYRSVSDEAAFCPDHAIVAKFADSQCPGCVGGWGDCDLHRAFAYSRLHLSQADFAMLETGICPKRTGGTFSIQRGATGGVIEHIDLRDPPVVEAGRALATAIRQYSLKYHNKEATTNGCS